MAEQKTITVRNAIGLGVGSMVGAGIFALLGEAAAMAGSAVWLMFLAAGVIALLTDYSFVQLGIRYPTRGGVVEAGRGVGRSRDGSPLGQSEPPVLADALSVCINPLAVVSENFSATKVFLARDAFPHY
jgi:hypothetical protein